MRFLIDQLGLSSMINVFLVGQIVDKVAPTIVASIKASMHSEHLLLAPLRQGKK